MEPYPSLPEPPSVPDANDRSLGMWMHLGPLLAFFGNFLLPIPFLPLITAGVLYYTQKDKSAFAAVHGKESLNFQITLLLIGLVIGIVVAAVMGASFFGLVAASSGDVSGTGAGAAGLVGLGMAAIAVGGVFFLLMLAVLALLIIASMRANQGQYYRYPISLRLVK